MKITLDKTYGWLGQSYGPGFVEIPDDLAAAIGTETPVPQSEPIADQTDLLSLPPQPTDNPDNLVNINTATAPEIADRLSGVGTATAVRVVSLRDSLPDRAFTDFDQLKQIARVDWDALKSSITLG